MSGSLDGIEVPAVGTVGMAPRVPDAGTSVVTVEKRVGDFASLDGGLSQNAGAERHGLSRVYRAGCRRVPVFAGARSLPLTWGYCA